MKALKILYKSVLWLILILFLLGLIFYFLLRTKPFQNYLVTKATTYLTSELGSKVSVGEVDISILNEFKIKKIFVSGKTNDTIATIGSLNIKITDWFFLKEQTTLHYLALEDATFNLIRNDSNWNYKHIEDYFTSGSTIKKSSGKKVVYDFKVINLKNVKFNKQDNYLGSHQLIIASTFDLFTDDINIAEKKIGINTITLDKIYFSDSVFAGNIKKWGILKKVKKISDIKEKFQWNTDDWKFSVGTINIKNGTYVNISHHATPTQGLFDGLHLNFSEINGNIKAFNFIGDTLNANVDITTKERCGLIAKQLKADYKLTPKIMEFKNLILETNKSLLQNYYSMEYNNFNRDMANYIHSVTMQASFNDSYIHSDDIAFFAPTLKNTNKKIEIKSGKAIGTVDDFKTTSLSVNSDGTIFDGNISMKGLPDINTTFLDVNSKNFNTTFNNLKVWVPSIANITMPNLQKLNAISYKGIFKGYINNFNLDGTINSSLGSVKSNLNLDFSNEKKPKYRGTLLSNSFNLGSFINRDDITIIGLDGNFDGQGLALKELDVNYKGKINDVTYKGVKYKNIFLDGNFKDTTYKGILSVNDDKIKINQIDGNLSFGKKGGYKLKADIASINLKQLGLTKDDIEVKGNFDIDLKGSNVNELSGEAKIKKGIIKVEGEKYDFDVLNLRADYHKGGKKININTNEFDINIDGKYKIDELPDAFTIFLNRYFPIFIKEPKNVLKNQQFNFDITTRKFDKYLPVVNKFLFKKNKEKLLYNLNEINLRGNLDLPNSVLSLEGNIPYFNFNNIYKFSNLAFTSNGNYDSLTTTMSASDLYLTKDSAFYFPNTLLTVISKNDLSKVQLKTSATKNIGDAFINADILTLENGFDINFNQSDIFWNDQKWEIEKNGLLSFSKKQITESELVLSHGSQRVRLKTEYNAEGGSLIDLKAKLENINIADFTPLFMNDSIVKIDGLITGPVTVESPFAKQKIKWDDLTIDNLVINEKPIGKMISTGSFDITTLKAKYYAEVDESKYKFKINGAFNPDNIDNEIATQVSVQRFDLNFLEPYLESVFSVVNGNAESELTINGSVKNPVLTGDLLMKKANMKVKYTQCNYLIDNQKIKFQKDFIDLDGLVLNDINKNKANASGKIYHNLFTNFSFDNIAVKSNRILALNTTKRDNALYYGKVIAKVDFKLNGLLENLVLDVKGEPSLLDTSKIFVSSSENKEASKVDYIKYIKYGNDELKKIDNNTKNFKLAANIDITANKACKIDVILDELTQDVLKVSEGEGNILINYVTGNNLLMNGEYTVKKGEYTYNFQDVIKKQFFLKENGKIKWTGDALNAIVDIGAVHKLKSVDLSNLTGATGTTGKVKAAVDIVSSFTGSLLKPDIKFELFVSGVTPTIEVQQKLDFLKDEKNKNEMNKEIASLILFSSFINQKESLLNGSAGVSFVANTLGGLINNMLSNKFNSLLQSILKNETYALDFSVSGNGDSDNLSLANNRAQLALASKLGITKTLMNNRLIISVGGNIDLRGKLANQTNNNSIVSRDISIEYIVDKNGNFRLVAFNRNNQDLFLNSSSLDRRLGRFGLSIVYRKEFEFFKEILNANK